MYIHRILEEKLIIYQEIFPVVAILGPRQCGKSTLVKKIFQEKKNYIYLDLQNTEDINKLTDPYLFFKSNQDKTICIDEIQLKPVLFSVLRSCVDENRKNGKFILLGSASKELVQQGSESLAGRIGYLSLTPFLINEVQNIDLYQLWNRGGYPVSVLSKNDVYSFIWRENFIKTYVERDIPQLGFRIPSMQLIRFLILCAHNQGQTINYSKIASSMDMTHPTIKKYVDLLEQTFILRTLQPFEPNTKKRLIKSPKVYVRDSGLLHNLLGIKNHNKLFGHPIFGASWEGFVIEQILSNFDVPSYFYRTAKGDEIDLIIEINDSTIAIECKASSSPKPTKGFYKAIEDIQPKMSYIVAPISSSPYQLAENIIVTNSIDLIQELKKYEN